MSKSSTGNKADNSNCFAGKVVIVTGASSGIGAATAINFAKLGACVAITGRNLQNLQKTCEQCAAVGKKPHLIQADLTKEADVKKVITSTIQHFKKLDVLVNNAGIFELSGVTDAKLDLFDRTFTTNVRAVYQMTSLAIPYLVETKGNIVNVSSVFGTRPSDLCTAYCMSKAALDQFTKCVSLELAPKQVRVNSIAPGVILTDIFNRTGLSPDQIKQFIDHQAKIHPIGRAGQAEEVADLITFLASDKAGFITGATVPIDGGYQQAGPR